jgi:hypothetical protein
MNKLEDKPMTDEHDTLKAHYDFDYSKAKPNRFAPRLTQESLMVVLDPDVAAIFPTSEAVNETLRVLAAALQNLPPAKAVKRRKPRGKRATPVQS